MQSWGGISESPVHQRRKSIGDDSRDDSRHFPDHLGQTSPFLVILGMVYDWFNHITPKYWMVGGLEHEFYFSISYGMSSFPLAHIFQMGRSTTNQIIIPLLTTIKTILTHY
jgi:hypothetical protein